MSVSSGASNAVIAKARAIFGHSLTAEDYIQLSSKESVSDVCAYLKQTARYGAALSPVNPQTVHRGQLEAILKRSVFDIFESFHRFDFTESKKFFEYIVMQREIDVILSALQEISSGNSERYIARLPMFLTKHSQTDLVALGTARNYVEAAQILAGTTFSKSIGTFLINAAESGKLDVGECERRLYTQYYMTTLKTAEKNFRGGEKKELKRVILRSIDMQNVVMLYRYTRFFGADSGTVKEKLIPFKYRLSNEAIERLAAQKDITKIVSELENIGYRSSNTPATVEQLTERISLDSLRKTMRLSQSSAVVYFALAECLSIELNNIKTLIEGVRYGLSGSEILEMIVV